VAAGAPSAAPLLLAAQDLIGVQGGEPAAELELLLSAALVDVAVDIVDPAESSGQAEVLRQAAGSPQIFLALQERLPADPAFWRLRAATQQYRAIETAGGWPALPPGPKLDVGSKDARVAVLRQRLRATGDLGDSGPAEDEFDIALHAAVSRFQARHGLEVDGIVGANTLAALNLPVSARLAAMKLNLRRLQQQRRQWGPRYLAVNAAASSYRLVDDGQKIFERVAIVGRRDWPTPEVDSVIDRLEFNPYWTVPPRIAKLELLPKIHRDPDYMRANDMQWVDGQIRQNPGAKNPLGKVKFLFPNPYSVYLHDTNNAGNFERWDRYLSHGCIRVAGALDLAAYLLQDDPQWPPSRIAEVLQSGQVTRVRLAAPIPVHIVYDTAWVDDDGVLQFRPDIYRRE
jgi:murein L,D-transpeptidase YcbB/YkuD